MIEFKHAASQHQWLNYITILHCTNLASPTASDGRLPPLLTTGLDEFHLVEQFVRCLSENLEDR